MKANKKDCSLRAAFLAACALTLSSLPTGQAWAAEIPDSWQPEIVDGNKLIIRNATNTVQTNYTYQGRELGSFDTVEIYYVPSGINRPLGVYSARYDLQKTNIVVHYVENGGSENNDALHLSNHYPHFNIRSFYADVTANSSDGINLSHDITSDDGSLEASVVIGNDEEPAGINGNGDLTLIIKNGSGIRANASCVADNVTNSIVVKGTTDITLNGNSNPLEVYHPTAVYAGGDSYYDSTQEDGKWVDIKIGGIIPTGKSVINTSVKGRGIIDLQGQTKLHLNGDGNYGLWAGKNGSVTAHRLYIESSGNNAYGVAATNGNITWGGHFLGSDDSANKYGSSVTLNGDINYIQMNGTNSYAVYASGVDDQEEQQQNSVKSGENGIGTIDFTGDVMAENSGLIDLKVTGTEQNYLEGDIKAYGTTENIDVGATVNLDVRNALFGQGTIAAANGGTVELTLGAGSNWTGRADDYQDAGSENWDDHNMAIDNAFGTKTISSNGMVNLSLGEGAMWNVEGQSWVTKLSGADSIVFLAKNDENTGEAVGQALHVGTLEDSHTFVMNVAAKNGDMLYVKNGTGAQQHLVINNREEVLGNMAEGEKIRFATVQNAGGGFKEGDVRVDSGTFGTGTRIAGAGVFNVDFGIEYNNYGENVTGDKAGEDAETANDAYNGDGFSADKPGSDYVENNYGVSDNVSGQNLLAEEDDVSDTNDLDGTQNVYIVREANTMDDLSNGGKTVIAMSKVNYSNAVYMDRLNKRMGEARYIDGDDGLWVRMRHDRIGKEDAFRSMNTMFELGYDWHAKGQKDGEHRQGVAFDYMRGTADYKNVAGDGDVRRAGVWLYDTWLGDKGHYSDYVVKYGRLSNDFDIYGELGNKIDGDYDNDVWSVSAEYGRKKDIGNDWYFEPQVQAQYAYVTSADYTTSQNTKVSLDGIDSLIGRAGFRLGRDTSEGNTVYFKADILHEFLGDQRVHASDITGALDTTYDNEGTWYDVGFGFSHRMGEDSYMFLDVEHSFGNDNEDTYQINIGLNRAF